MDWYWYWLRIDKETRIRFTTGCFQFSSRMKAIEHGKKKYHGQPLEIEELRKEKKSQTIYISQEAKIIKNEGQYKIFS